MLILWYIYMYIYIYIYAVFWILWINTDITHTMGKVWAPISQAHSIRCVLLHFSGLWEIDGETHPFPITWSIPQDGNLMGKKPYTIGKIWVSISQTFPIPWVLLHFPVLWEIYRETYAFPIWRHWLMFSCGSRERKYY